MYFLFSYVATNCALIFAGGNPLFTNLCSSKLASNFINCVCIAMCCRIAHADCTFLGIVDGLTYEERILFLSNEK